MIHDILLGSSSNLYISGKCTVNGKGDAIKIIVYKSSDMSMVYHTNSFSNGNYICIGLPKNQYTIVGIDSSRVYTSVIKRVDELQELPYMQQIELLNNWSENIDTNIPIEKNVALTLSAENTTLLNDYHGVDTLNGLVEGGIDGKEYNIILYYANSVYKTTTYTPEFTINDIYIDGIEYISINDVRVEFDIELHQNIQRGYISASVVIGECGDSDFVIHCFRSSDKQFIGEYPIINDRYTIDNLNLASEYDIMLHDKNKVVETQVHSRRTPSIYQ